MAKIKFGMMMTDARGKLGGQVFSKNRSGAYIRTKVTPSNPQSARQSAIRSLFAAISAAWSILTAAQRAGWNGAVASWATTDVFGDLKNPSGKNLHQRLNQNLGNTEQTLIEDVPAKIDLPTDQITAVDIAVGAATLTLTGAYDTAGTAVQVFGTTQLSQGTSFVKDKLRQIYTADAAAVTPADAYTAYVAKFGAPVAGDNVFIAARYVGDNGQASVLQTVKATVSA